jgi:TIGR03009 family protein
MATTVLVTVTSTCFGQPNDAAPRTAYGPRRGPAPATAYQPPAPREPFKLAPAEQNAVDQLLKYWEQFSGRVQRYRCKFTRWEYDSSFGSSDRDTARTRSEGEIRYEAPDKGLFRVDKIAHYTPQADGTATYVANPNERGEHWICNGEAIIQYDYKNKHLKVAKLPPNMQGSAIADGPLPFLFGAKAEKIKARYWVRIIPPPQGQQGKEYWIQAYPKTRQDAANFKLVEVILDAKLFLPSAIQVYDLSYNARTNFSRTVYVFDDRKVNERFSAEALNIFKKPFFDPSVPFGWKKVEEKFNGAAAVPRATPPPTRPEGRSAQQPVYGPRR